MVTLAASHSSGPRPPMPKGWPDEEAACSTVMVTVFVSEKPFGPGSTALNVTVYTPGPWLFSGVQTKLPRSGSKEAPEGRLLAERVAKSSTSGFVALTLKMRRVPTSTVWAPGTVRTGVFRSPDEASKVGVEGSP